MNCFQLIAAVLEEEYSQIPGQDAEKDEAIRSALVQLRKHYKDVTKQGPGNYAERVTRFAYIYSYVTCHANLVYSLISGKKPLRALFDRDEVEVACIGGGPGSDFLGVLKYLMEAGLLPKVRCWSFDKEQAWAESWSDVDKKIDPKFRLTVQPITIDVTRRESWEIYTKYFNADLFTLVYFCSEVSRDRGLAEEYFTTLFERAKAGSLFLFIDNRAAEHYGWFDELAKKCGIQVLEHGEERLTTPSEEEKKDLGRFFEKFGDPKLEALVAWRIGAKK
jgi:hypothetical protein